MRTKIYYVLALRLSISSIQAQSIEKLFKKYSDSEFVEYIAVGKSLMKLVAPLADYSYLTDGELQSISSIKSISLKNNTANQELSAAISKDLDKIIQKENFETTLEKRDKKQYTYVYRKLNINLNADYIIYVSDNTGLKLVWLKGKTTPEAIEQNNSED